MLMTATLLRVLALAHSLAACHAAEAGQGAPGSSNAAKALSGVDLHKASLNLTLSSAWASKHVTFLASLQNAHLLPLDAKDPLHQLVRACLMLHGYGGTQPHVIRAHLLAALEEAQNSTGSHSWDVLADAALRSSTLLGELSGGARKLRGARRSPRLLATSVISELLVNGQHMDCRPDPTLPMGLPKGSKFLVATNLKNNAPLMPHFILQLLKALLPSEGGDVYVSVYESASSDDTPKWCALLELLLAVNGIPHTVAAAGSMRRGPNENRIVFLSKLRNVGLAPLFRAPGFPDGFPADRVVYLNDVWWCAPHMWRLALYRSADIACGLDFDRVPARRRLLRAARRLLDTAESVMGSTQEDGTAQADVPSVQQLKAQQRVLLGAAGSGGGATVAQAVLTEARMVGAAMADWTSTSAQQAAQKVQGSTLDGDSAGELAQVAAAGPTSAVWVLRRRALHMARVLHMEVGHEVEAAAAGEPLSSWGEGEVREMARAARALMAVARGEGTAGKEVGGEAGGAAGEGSTLHTSGAAVGAQGMASGTAAKRARRLRWGWLDEDEDEDEDDPRAVGAQSSKSLTQAASQMGSSPGMTNTGGQGYGQWDNNPSMGGAAGQGPSNMVGAGGDTYPGGTDYWGLGAGKEGGGWGWDGWGKDWKAPSSRLAYRFYDIWVGRDVSGRKFEKGWPVLSHNNSREMLEGGWPFPVVCCWDGMVVLNAQPFRRHGLRFRSHGPGECRSSECTLMCDDMWRTGHTRALVDPSIRQVYEPYEHDKLYGTLFDRNISVRSWTEVVARHTQQGWAQVVKQPNPTPASGSSPPATTAGAPTVTTPAATDNTSAAATAAHAGLSGPGQAIGAGAAAGTGGGHGEQVQQRIPLEQLGLTSLGAVGGPSGTQAASRQRRRRRRDNKAGWAGGLGGGGGGGYSDISKGRKLLASESAGTVPHAAGDMSVVPTGSMLDVVANFWVGIKAPEQQECCQISTDPKNDIVDFYNCDMRSFLQPNHTADFLAALARVRQRLQLP